MGILRFILAVAVVIDHSGSIFGIHLIGGLIAVKAFYIISGFYMTLVLKEKYIGIHKSYKLFITNRLLRLYPIYWTVLLLTVLISIVTAIYTKGSYWGPLTSFVNYCDKMNFGTLAFLIFTNTFLFFQDALLFLGLNTSTGSLFFTAHFQETYPLVHKFLFIPQAWTIGVELLFYMIAPFIITKKLKIISVFFLLSILLRLVLMHYGLKDDPWSYRFFPIELTFFLGGAISYHLFIKVRTMEIKTLYLKIILVLLLVTTLLLEFINFTGKNHLYLVFVFICIPFIFLLTKKWKMDSFFGDLSYPIYISHLFVFTCINSFKLPKIGEEGLSLVVLSVLFSIILNELIAKRIERIRQNRVKQIIKI